MELGVDGWSDGSERVEAVETVLRRVPSSYLEGKRKDRVTYRAFRPRQTKDERGISLVRAKYNSPRGVAAMPPACPFVLSLKAAHVFDAGATLVPDPLPPDNPGHCLLPELHSGNRDSADALRLQETLLARSAKLGPFATDAPGGGA